MLKKQENLGLMGEKLVRNILMSSGHMILDSLNLFDNRKDFTSNGKSCEVKTEQPYVLKNCFSFRKNQLTKCRTVDELYIVSVPPLARPTYEHGGKVFLVDPKTFEQTSYKTKSGLDMIGIPIVQKSVKCIYTMTAEERNQFMRYAESEYRRL